MKLGCEPLYGNALEVFEIAARSATLVTVDLFDTLVIRTFRKPTDLFVAMAASLRKSAPNTASIFAQVRIAAEIAVRAKAARDGRHEVTLREIYEEVGKAIAAGPPHEDLPIADLMALELSLEIACATPDEAVVSLVTRLIDKGLRVVILSDTYLPIACIATMIEKIGIRGHFALQLSCEVGVCKADGSGWLELRQRYGLAEGERIAHLGDNRDADGTMPRRHGIESVLLTPPADRRISYRLVDNSHWFIGSCEALLYKALRRYAGRDDVDAYWLILTYLVVLPTAMGFCTFIADQANSCGNDRVFFLARDGLIFKKVFEILFHTSAVDSRKNYIWASRRCLNLSGIEKFDTRALDFLLSGAYLSPADYLRRIDLDPAAPEISTQVDRIFDDPERVIHRDETERMRALFSALAGPVEQRASLERDGLFVHLRQSGLFDSPAMVVDLGWHGTLQRSLVELGRMITGREVALEGAYLGTSKLLRSLGRSAPLKITGWLFDKGNPAQALMATVGKSYEVIELLFSAPHPSINHVYLADGVPTPAYIEDPAETHRLKIAALIHGEVEAATAELRHLAPFISAPEWHTLALEQLSNLLINPDANDVQHFLTVRHNEGFGASRYKPIIAKPVRSFNPSDILSAANDSFWFYGYVASLNSRQRSLLWISRGLQMGGRILRVARERLSRYRL